MWLEHDQSILRHVDLGDCHVSYLTAGTFICQFVILPGCGFSYLAVHTVRIVNGIALDREETEKSSYTLLYNCVLSQRRSFGTKEYVVNISTKYNKS